MDVTMVFVEPQAREVWIAKEAGWMARGGFKLNINQLTFGMAIKDVQTVTVVDWESGHFVTEIEVSQKEFEACETKEGLLRVFSEYGMNLAKAGKMIGYDKLQRTSEEAKEKIEAAIGPIPESKAIKDWED